MQEFLQPFCTAFVSTACYCTPPPLLSLCLLTLVQDALVVLKKQMHSISLEGGFMIAFKKVRTSFQRQPASFTPLLSFLLPPPYFHLSQFGESLYIAMSKGHGETEEDLLRKTQVFNSILSFLVGPVKRRYPLKPHPFQEAWSHMLPPGFVRETRSRKSWRDCWSHMRGCTPRKRSFY